MDAVLLASAVVLLVMVVVCSVCSVRNERVFRFRSELITHVSAAAQTDPAWGDWMWRFRVYQSVGYHRMVWMFWKPLRVEAWYPSADFITPRSIEGK